MMAQQSTIVGVFDDRLQADRAVDELRRAGFRDDQIGVAMRHDAGDVAVGDVTDARGRGRVATPGRARSPGSLTGLGLGALAGLGVLSGVIPVIGPAIAGGTLGIILSNAAVGAGVGGLVGALVGAGIPEDEAHYYQGEFEVGPDDRDRPGRWPRRRGDGHPPPVWRLRHEQPPGLFRHRGVRRRTSPWTSPSGART